MAVNPDEPKPGTSASDVLFIPIWGERGFATVGIWIDTQSVLIEMDPYTVVIADDVELQSFSRVYWYPSLPNSSQRPVDGLPEYTVPSM